MIVLCPKCKTKYRVDESKIGDEGARLKCQNCQIVFRVRKPQAAQQQAPKPVPAPAAPVPRPPAAPAAAPPKPPPTPAPEPITGPLIPDRAPKATILVADVDEEYLQRISGEVVKAGYTVYQARDGISAMKVIKDKLPEVAILEVVLPQKFGFEIAESVKADPDLKNKVKIILIGSVYEKDRFRRAPQSLYGADEYVEKHHDGEEVVAKIEELLSAPVTPQAQVPEAAPPPKPAAPPPVAPPRPPAAPPKVPPPAPAAVPPPRPAVPPPAVPPRPPAAPPQAPPAPAAAPPPRPAAPPPVAPPRPPAAPPKVPPPAPAAAPPPKPVAQPPAAPPRPPAAAPQAPQVPAAAPKPMAKAIPPGAGAWAQDVPDDPVHQKAARLARTTVADIALYNPKELEQGLREGNWREILAKDIEDGKKHWESKTPPEVRSNVNYFDLALEDLAERKKKEYGLA